MRYYQKKFVKGINTILIIIAICCIPFSSACINENKIYDFESVQSDFQIVADDILFFYRQSEEYENGETLNLCICYDQEARLYYLNYFVIDDTVVSDDTVVLSALERVADAFDNDFPLWIISVNESYVYFCNSTGDYAVVFSVNGTAPNSFSLNKEEKIKKRIKENNNWYQIFR